MQRSVWSKKLSRAPALRAQRNSKSPKLKVCNECSGPSFRVGTLPVDLRPTVPPLAAFAHSAVGVVERQAWPASRVLVFIGATAQRRNGCFAVEHRENAAQHALVDRR